MARTAEGFDIEFDIVVMGAGSAGCVVASRLADASRLEVCLIEAGGQDSNPWFHVPMGFGKTVMNPKYGWGYRTEPDPGLSGRSLSWIRGKVLGGSGSINGLVFLRGAREDFDAWEREGARGWGYDAVLPYFRRMERSTAGDDAQHGRSGPITITENKRPSDTAKAFVASCESLQNAYNSDFNGGKLDGVGFVPINVHGRWRHSTASAYLRTPRKRANLRVMTETTASRILFDGKRAIGLEVVCKGRTLRIGARKQIVLSGGAINSPALLLMSGIGPAAELRQVGVDVVHDLPGVGKNLQDHVNVGLAYATSVKDSVNVALTSRWRSALLMADWFFKGGGPIAGGAVEATLFASTDAAEAVPDMQYSLMNFSRDAAAQPYRDAGCTLLVNLCRPKSRGELRLKRDAALAVAIHPGYFSDADDMRRMKIGFEYACRLAEAEPLKSLIVERRRPAAPVLASDDIEDYIRNNANTTYHPCGTCRMGDAPSSVVDSELRVRGIEGLRVVDASVMPTIPSPNIHPATIMIAEKGADLIGASLMRP